MESQTFSGFIFPIDMPPVIQWLTYLNPLRYFLVIIRNGQIIEIYPTDRPYPSCLVFGQNIAGDPIHSVWAFNAKTEWAVLITVYRPDPDRWVDWRKRKE